MKIYENPIMRMLIEGCSHCPNRTAQRVKNGEKFSTIWVCKKISIPHKNPISGLDITIHPNLKEPMMTGGFLHNCPLPDADPECILQRSAQ